jgi:glycosyl transferase family 87
VFSDVKIHASKQSLLMLALGIVAIALCIDVLHRNDPIGVDFHTYVAAGQVGVEQGWPHIYDQVMVDIEQVELSPSHIVQPFLSPPTVAYVTAPLGYLPYDVAYVVWAVLLLGVFAAALAWSGVSTGWSKWIAVIGALSPWWVMHAVNVGQIVPIEAAGCVIASRLVRERRDMLAGLALATILFKPNNAILIPFALLFATRFRLFASWAGAAVLVSIVELLTVGVGGLSQYVTQLRGPLPRGADDLTLHGALTATGTFAAVLRVLIVGGVLAGAYRMRKSPGLVIPLAIIGSLLISPYLHASDLAMLAAAGFMTWEEKPSLAWRAPLIATWVAASPFIYDVGWSPRLKRWPLFEIMLLVVLLLAAWWPSLTAGVTLRRRAPA